MKDAVLITGCSSGIGRATAARLAEAGWPVWATARRPESLADLEGLGCRTLGLDVTDPASVAAAVEAVEAEHGAVGALVNNAGYSLSGALETLEVERVRRQFETNVFGLLDVTQRVLPGMRRAGRGRIVNVGSMGGRFTFPGGGAYHASKHALEALTDALRFEVRGFGIDVVLIQPGLILTGFGKAAVGQMEFDDEGPYAGFDAAVAKATVQVYEEGPLARLGGTPQDVARVIERALVARRPRSRYKVTLSARLLLGLRALLPDGLWDAFMRTTFPEPGPR